MSIINMQDLNLSGKKILIRADLNVPIINGKITSDARILAFIPTIQLALKKNAKIIICSHLGRPIEGKYETQFSLFPVFKYLKKILNISNIFFLKNNINYINEIDMKEKDIFLLENVRFNIGEKNNSKTLSKKYASLCDVFIMDAFGSAHRKHASTEGVARIAETSCAGPLLISEIKNLSKILHNPIRPMVTIVGGAKISTKFKLLKSLAKTSDTVILGGGIANTFLAINNNIGKSLHEPKFIKLAKLLKQQFNNFYIPVDCQVSTLFSKNAQAIPKDVNNIANNEEIMDVGDKTIMQTRNIIKNAKTILWNGPVGVFEFKNFQKGTKNIAMAIAYSNSFSVAGGGDTLSVIDTFGIKNKISYISTGGGAFLEFIEGKKLPAIKILEQRAK